MNSYGGDDDDNGNNGNDDGDNKDDNDGGDDDDCLCLKKKEKKKKQSWLLKQPTPRQFSILYTPIAKDTLISYQQIKPSNSYYQKNFPTIFVVYSILY